MKMDICASKARDEVCIFHDSPFEKEPTGIVFDPYSGYLDFVFDGETRPLGAPIDKSLAPYLQKSDKIVFFEMDMAAQKAVNAFEVPLEIKPAAVETEKKSDKLAGIFSKDEKDI